LARALLRCLLHQILVAGIFHADPHPGNLYLTTSGKVALIDCGSVGLLDRRQRAALQAVLFAVAAQDPAQLRDGLRQITTRSKTIDERLLERGLGSLLMQHLSSGTTPGSALFTALMELMREFGLAVDPPVGGALRALATVQSTLELLAPGFQLIDEAKAYAQTLFNPFTSPVRPRSAAGQLQAVLPNLLPALTSLPRRADRLLDAAEQGEITVGIHLFPTDRDRAFAHQLTAQLAGVIAAAAASLTGAILILAATPDPRTGGARILLGAGIGCAGIGLLALLSGLVTALRRQRERP